MLVRDFVRMWTMTLQKLNGPELLRMLICYDYLDKAAAITLEYIDAVLGVSPEQFNVKVCFDTDL